MSDRDDIAERLAELAAAIDARDWESVRAAFLPNAHGYRKDGAEAIVRQISDHLGACGPTQHLLGNHRITVDGDTARSLTYARVHHSGAGAMAGKFFECMGEYDDRWVRTPEGWRLSSRVFDMRIFLGDFGVFGPAES
ncbi:SnoaL-like domain-containing protein [Saccharopolyspora antimicrobica]|uniref:SnoaL-like domain-containing protein n=1 Tax=Saccharopolyspora antimicrobica TaxID=455193 RepID=A0A1I5JXH8_9PSEU|nr:nuclear transport factor 2 family protein [Saccharopolyspora antimicrobica]RKT86991.1 SnoaL-like protein [Saccharopolyspora antimicrobica]SFO77512.1 SnoaL-like domain-containing protein [Saccharopolyspora antimicrobica]